MPRYSYATLNDAITALGSRLYDPTFQQWTKTELTGYVVEALQTWNALTSFWRAEMAFSMVPSQWWYDLRTVPGTIIPYTGTQYSLISQIQNHLLEPPTPAAWSGTGQFSLSDLLAALQRRQDDVLGVTGCTVTQSTVGAFIGSRIVLPDTAIDILRVAWLPAPGLGYSNKILRQSDMLAERAFNPYYTTKAQTPPSVWMQNAEPPASFDVDSASPVPGLYDVLSINAGPKWVAGTNATIPIPTDWCWMAKWGALADLLSRESNSKDALRAEYCRRRYAEALRILNGGPTVLAARLQNIPIALDPVRNGDDFRAGWQAETPGYPTAIFIAGNMVAFAPAPNGAQIWSPANYPWGPSGILWQSTGGGQYSGTFSVVQNAPIPAVPGDYLQVSRDNFDTIIDYAHHLAMFKAGGSEFAATVAMYQAFQQKAAQYNGKLKEMGFFSMTQQELGNAEEQRNPRYSPGTMEAQ